MTLSKYEDILALDSYFSTSEPSGITLFGTNPSFRQTSPTCQWSGVFWSSIGAYGFESEAMKSHKKWRPWLDAPFVEADWTCLLHTFKNTVLHHTFSALEVLLQQSSMDKPLIARDIGQVQRGVPITIDEYSQVKRQARRTILPPKELSSELVSPHRITIVYASQTLESLFINSLPIDSVAVLIVGAAVSSGVLAAPTRSLMIPSSIPPSSISARGLQSQSSSDGLGTMSAGQTRELATTLQHGGVEHANTVPRQHGDLTLDDDSEYGKDGSKSFVPVFVNLEQRFDLSKRGNKNSKPKGDEDQSLLQQQKDASKEATRRQNEAKRIQRAAKEEAERKERAAEEKARKKQKEEQKNADKEWKHYQKTQPEQSRLLQVEIAAGVEQKMRQAEKKLRQATKKAKQVTEQEESEEQKLLQLQEPNKEAQTQLGALWHIVERAHQFEIRGCKERVYLRMVAIGHPVLNQLIDNADRANELGIEVDSDYYSSLHFLLPEYSHFLKKELDEARWQYDQIEREWNDALASGSAKVSKMKLRNLVMTWGTKVEWMNILAKQASKLEVPRSEQAHAEGASSLRTVMYCDQETVQLYSDLQNRLGSVQ
ncbi:hypothetical protein EV360DRAFT_72352 [Lentinula raphanica]|nr:hypothetical protein EV360DRAFT_72352 [Lentinula raphanica]